MRWSLVIMVLIAWASPGCRQPADRGGLDGRTASKGSMGRPKPMKSTATPRPQPPGGMGTSTGVAAAAKKRLEACQALYRARVMRLSALLDKLGVHRTDAQLAKDYGLHLRGTLRACIELTPSQRRCVIKQPNPLLAGQPCRLAGSLGLRVPTALVTQLRPKPVSVDDATARHLLAGLRGRWVHQASTGRRVELVIGPGGQASFRRFRDNRPDGGVQSAVFSMRHRQELIRRRAVTEQSYVYFRLNRNTFLLSGNPLHNATPIRSRTGFRLILARDRVLHMAAGQCEVIDLGHLAAHKATCTWERDDVTQIPVLRVAYMLGRWEQKLRFFLVTSHLLHERLYQRRFVRR